MGAAIGKEGIVEWPLCNESGDAAMQADKMVNEELLRMKRILWELQRENQDLRKGQSLSAQSPERSRCPSGKPPVSSAECDSLRSQVGDLKKALHQAEEQTDRLMRQQALQAQVQQRPLGGSMGTLNESPCQARYPD